jgi:hypothetical protein
VTYPDRLQDILDAHPWTDVLRWLSNAALDQAVQSSHPVRAMRLRRVSEVLGEQANKVDMA